MQDELDLINELWNGIASGGTAVPISDEFVTELERRLAAYRVDPNTSSSAEQMRQAVYDAIGG